MIDERRMDARTRWTRETDNDDREVLDGFFFKV